MKILSLSHTSASGFPEVLLIPDSAITPTNMPVFVPDFASDWQVSWHIAFRIGRLGKDIALKFASRYLDGVTLATRLVTHSGELSPGLIACGDYTLTLGNWIDIPNVLNVQADNFAMETTLEHTGIKEAIVKLSSVMTVKTGDLLLMPLFHIEEVPSALRGQINGHKILEKRIIKK